MTRRTVFRQPLALTSLDGTGHDLHGWLTARLCGQLPGIHQIDPQAQLIEYGLDSVVALGLSGEIEEVFGVLLEPGVVYDCSTVDELAHHLADRAAADRRRGEARS